MRLLCTAMSSRLMIEGAFSCIRGFEIVPAIGMVEDARGGGQKRQECRFPEVWRVGVRGRVRPRFFLWEWEGVGGT